MRDHENALVWQCIANERPYSFHFLYEDENILTVLNDTCGRLEANVKTTLNLT